MCIRDRPRIGQLDIGGADEREIALVGNGKRNAFVGVLEDVGVVVLEQPPYLLIDAHGVGYELEASLTTFQTLPEVGAEVTLLTLSLIHI